MRDRTGTGNTIRSVFEPEEATRAAEQKAASAGGSALRHLMLDFLTSLQPRLPEMPTVAVTALDVAQKHWSEGEGAADELASARVAIWEHLDAKHGTSVMVSDKEDHLLRAVLCVLYPEADDLEDVAYFFRDCLVAVA